MTNKDKPGLELVVTPSKLRCTHSYYCNSTAVTPVKLYTYNEGYRRNQNLFS